MMLTAHRSLWRPAGPPSRAGAHREAGLTAIETSVVLAIVGVLALSTYPVVQGFLELNRAKGALEQVASAMRLGRQYAIGTVATYGVTMTATTFQVACNAGCPAGAPTEPTATVLHEATLVSDDGIALTDPVLFTPLGDATAARGVIVRAEGVADQRVCVSGAGRIVVTAPGAACPGP